jgi:hypothetical protein
LVRLLAVGIRFDTYSDITPGAALGAYVTANNGTGTTPAYISRWRYIGIAQQIDANTFVPSW